MCCSPLEYPPLIARNGRQIQWDFIGESRTILAQYSGNLTTNTDGLQHQEGPQELLPTGVRVRLLPEEPLAPTPGTNVVEMRFDL